MIHIQIQNNLIQEGFNKNIINKFLKEHMQIILKYNNKNWKVNDWTEIFKLWNEGKIDSQNQNEFFNQKHREKVYQWVKKSNYFSAEKMVSEEGKDLRLVVFDFHSKGKGYLYISKSHEIWDWTFKTREGKEIGEFGELEIDFAKIIISYNEFLTDPQIIFV